MAVLCRFAVVVRIMMGWNSVYRRPPATYSGDVALVERFASRTIGFIGYGAVRAIHAN